MYLQVHFVGLSSMTFLYFVVLQHVWRLLYITTANCGRKQVCALLITSETSVELCHVNMDVALQRKATCG